MLIPNAGVALAVQRVTLQVVPLASKKQVKQTTQTCKIARDMMTKRAMVQVTHMPESQIAHNTARDDREQYHPPHDAALHCIAGADQDASKLWLASSSPVIGCVHPSTELGVKAETAVPVKVIKAVLERPPGQSIALHRMAFLKFLQGHESSQ